MNPLLADLFSTGRIKLRRGSIFDAQPAAVDVQDLRQHQRVEGMLLGLAVGDALGHSTEWKYDAEQRHREFGTIVDHVGTATSTAGRISDDTQLSMWTLECLLARQAFDFDDLVKCFVERRSQVVGMGRNISGALARHADRLRTDEPPLFACPGDPYADGRGNGTIMRMAPLVLPHLRQPSPELYCDLVLAAFVTHANPAALAATVALGKMLWDILRQPVSVAPPPEWWLDEFVRVAYELEPWPPRFVAGHQPVPEYLRGFEGCLWELVDAQVRRAWQRGVSVRDACSLSGFGSGADCLQTVPAVLYILMHHADSFESAVIAAVNDTKDNDTIASIVGAFAGALHGRRAIRPKWLAGISSSSIGIDKGTNDRTTLVRMAEQAASRFLGDA